MDILWNRCTSFHYEHIQSDVLGSYNLSAFYNKAYKEQMRDFFAWDFEKLVKISSAKLCVD
ncbi:hypothetical protein [Methanosarcina barkeri]|uniref:hypothetical protein n=1 Tax=Methanosarcina barkeri TaxID=2208 RepID=UPI00064EF3C8|nr:hypothetical protein [Methanosarcina barkeri]OED10333.1 hypothetical protein A9239_07515 [Methanosarcina sp. A14]